MVFVTRVLREFSDKFWRKRLLNDLFNKYVTSDPLSFANDFYLSVDDVKKIESRLGRPAVEGSRTKPDGETLRWKQIGILATLEDRQLPFFVEWVENHHPSADGKPASKITAIEVAGEPTKVREYLGCEYKDALGNDIEIRWLSPSEADGDTGIIAVKFHTPSGEVLVD